MTEPRPDNRQPHSTAENVFDAHAESYSSNIDDALGKYGAKHEFFTAQKARLVRDLLLARGLTPNRMHLLDVGCGVGEIHKYFSQDFGAISGVDVSKRSLEVARNTYPAIDYQSYDGGRLPHDNEKFDLSIAICVFHHVPPDQWSHLAKEMLRVLLPGGMSIVIEHNPLNPVTRHIVNTCPLDADAVLLRASLLKNIFRDAGGVKVISRTILSVPPLNRVLVKADRFLGVLPLGAQYYVIAHKN